MSKAKKNTQTAELFSALKSTLAKLVVNVRLYIPTLEVQRCLNIHNAIKYVT